MTAKQEPAIFRPLPLMDGLPSSAKAEAARDLVSVSDAVCTETLTRSLLVVSGSLLDQRVAHSYDSIHNWWRSRISRLQFNEFKFRMGIIFDFATSITSGQEAEKCTASLAARHPYE